MKPTIKSTQVPSSGIVLCLLIVLASNSFAGSATWKASPDTNDWNTATNWTPQTVPDRLPDVATFATSSKTAVSLSSTVEVDSIVFNSGASAFTIGFPTNDTALSLDIGGTGVANNSATTQHFIANGDSSFGAGIYFLNSAKAGMNASYAINPTGAIYFNNASTADHASFTLSGGTSPSHAATLYFYNNSTAGNGTFTLNGPALVVFKGDGTTPLPSAGAGTFTLNSDSVNGLSSHAAFNRATAASASFTANGNTLGNSAGSVVEFDTGSTAGAATLVANPGPNGGPGGGIFFFYDSSGGTSRVRVVGAGTGDETDGTLDIEGHNAPGVRIGSLEGSGSVFLRSNNLTVGTNNLSTVFSGVIADLPGSVTGYFGSLTKTGKGRLTLTNASTYDGGTVINKGKLIVKNTTGSATGSGAVQVNSGVLGGTGRIGGTVTVGNGTTTGAVLFPGTAAKPGILTINNTLSFNSPATYKCTLNRTTSPPTMSKVKALGVTINSGVTFTLVDATTGTLAAGTSFTVINNTSANPIFGTFGNLADGGTITSGGTTFKANYHGGDGNDLTLTVQ
jgi:autotransporter-associated beta strand protein